MLAMMRARWYGFVRTFPFWGALLALFALAAFSARHTSWQEGVGYWGVLSVFQSMPALAYLLVLLCCLWFVSATTFDEKEDVLTNLLVDPRSRRNYVVAGLCCLCLQFLCGTVVLLAGCVAGMLFDGAPMSFGIQFAPAFLARWFAAFAVTLGYGSILCVLVLAMRRSAAVVVASFVMLLGVVEQALFGLGPSASSAGIGGALGKLSLRGQVNTLCTGDVPTAAATFFAFAVAVACAVLAVAVLKRRRM